jgi:hypothetical protein
LRLYYNFDYLKRVQINSECYALFFFLSFGILFLMPPNSSRPFTQKLFFFKFSKIVSITFYNSTFCWVHKIFFPLFDKVKLEKFFVGKLLVFESNIIYVYVKKKLCILILRKKKKCWISCLLYSYSININGWVSFYSNQFRCTLFWSSGLILFFIFFRCFRN